MSGNKSAIYYGICDTTWSDTKNKYELSVIDMAVLTQLSYEVHGLEKRANLTKTIDKYLGGNYEIVRESNDKSPVWFHIKHKQKNVHVDYIAIRGTKTSLDFAQDLSLFIEVMTFQFLSWLFPFFNAFPAGFKRTIVYYASTAEGLINGNVRDAFYDEIYNYSYHLLDKYENEDNIETNLYFVGHSLGSAIGQITAAKLTEQEWIQSHVSSFNLNSPGTLYTSLKFGFSMETLQLTSTNILTERDMIGMIDEHSGLTQTVDCNKDSFFECHLLATPLCELFDKCPVKTAAKSDIVDCWCNGDEEKIGYCVDRLY